jgi:GxxExxY protein
MKGDEEVLALCDQVRQIAYDLHAFLRHGHLEKVYETGLAHRLRKAGCKVHQQWPLRVSDEDGAVLGDYYADLFVNDCLLIELKACQALANDHLGQVLGYLRASRQRHAMLINFGSRAIQFRKVIL